MTSDEAATAFPAAGRTSVHSAGPVANVEGAEVADLGALVAAARQGEEAAFAELYRLLAPAVFDYLLTVIGDRAAAEDLLQQTFLQAWVGLGSLRAPGKFRPWVYAVARHVSQEHLRSRAAPLPLDGIPDHIGGGVEPEEIAVAREASQLVWDAAVSLDPHHREVLNLSIRHGLTVREIGEVMGLRAARTTDLLIRSREALGRAVQVLLVSRSAKSCPDLRVLVPWGAGSLTPEQRRAADRHVRVCPTCKPLAFQLTRPEELFGAIILAALPATAQHVPAPPPPPLAPANLAAAHTHGVRPLRQRLGLSNRRRLLTLGIGASLLLGMGAAIIPRVAPSPAPVPTPTVARSTPGSVWAESLQDMAALTSYRISFTTSEPVFIGVTGFDIAVGPAGSWYGTVTDASQPSYPMTLAYESGVLYVRGGHDFVAVAPDFFSLTTSQAQALGSGWLNVDTVQGLSDGTLLENAIAPFALPGALALELSLPLVTLSASPTTYDGQAAFQLSADGTVVEVTRGAHPLPLSIDEPPDHYTFSVFNQPVTPPDVSGAVTWSQLTGGSPPP
jgi:RNA polymerase sigma factor (sigma-70 family)